MNVYRAKNWNYSNSSKSSLCTLLQSKVPEDIVRRLKNQDSTFSILPKLLSIFLPNPNTKSFWLVLIMKKEGKGGIVYVCELCLCEWNCSVFDEAIWGDCIDAGLGNVCRVIIIYINLIIITIIKWLYWCRSGRNLVKVWGHVQTKTKTNWGECKVSGFLWSK